MTTLFLQIINMSVSASWLVLAVLLLRFCLKKAPRWAHVLLWGIVAVRLICPFSIESVFSLIPSSQTVSPEIMLDRTPEISTGISSLDGMVNPIITTVFAPDPIASANPLQILIPVAANFWLLGILAMVSYAAISYLLLCRKVATAVLLRENCFQSEHVRSPFVLGICKPRIYLPFQMDETQAAHVIAHEKAHITRKDHWWKPLGFLLLTLHWFNPLMWLAYALLCRDIELACDEKVIRDLGSEARADYTQALVGCSIRRSRIAACPLAFGEVGVKERVKSVLNYRKPSFWMLLLAVVLCAAVAVCFLTDPISAVRNPWVQEYVPGEPGILGSVDKSKYESISGDFAIGADKYGRAVFKDPHRAFDTFTALYADGISLIQKENDLRPISKRNYTAYKKLGWQTTSGPETARAQAAFVTKFLDIYENSFIKGAPIPDGTEIQTTQIAYELTPAGNMRAKILEIWDNCYLVEPVAGSWELQSADKITVPMKNVEPSPEPQVGDIIEVQYNGALMESYPAQIGKVYHIRVLQKTKETGKYYFTVGEPGVFAIEYSTEDSSGGCTNADGTAFQAAENVWLEGLDGLTDLRGVTVEALDEHGHTVWSISITDAEKNRGLTVVSDGLWMIRLEE